MTACPRASEGASHEWCETGRARLSPLACPAGCDCGSGYGATLPWSLMLTTTLTAVAANVVAQGDSDNIGCRITVNGDVREEHSVDGHNAQTSCLVKSA